MKLVYAAFTRCRCGAGMAYDREEIDAVHAAFAKAGRVEKRDEAGNLVSSRPDMTDAELDVLRQRDSIAKTWWCSKVLLDLEALADKPPTEDEAKAGAPAGWSLAFATAVRDKGGQVHDGYPFWCYEIKSEEQPSARGATTRPKP